MDLSRLSTDDLLALKSGDLSRVSTGGLQQLKSQMAQQRLRETNPEEYDPSSPQYQAKYGATAGMSGFDKFRAGWGKAVTDIGRGLGQFVSAGDRNDPSRRLVSRDDIAAARERDAALMGTGAGMAGNFAGAVTTLAPLAAVPGANTLAGSAAIGGALGLSGPSASTRETLTNTLGGAALGPLSLLAGRGVSAAYRGGKSLVEPLTKKGQERIAARTLEAFAGGRDAARQAAQNIATNAGDVLPGVRPTTAELANNAGLSQLERTVRNNPEYLSAFTDRMQANKNAMLGALDDIAGDASRRTAAVEARDAAVKPLYDEAKAAVITVDDELGRLFQRPSMSKALSLAKQLAAEEGDVAATAVAGQSSKGKPESLLKWLSKHSRGLSSEEAKLSGFDPADMRGGVTMSQGRVGVRGAFRRNGMTFDEAAEAAAEAGFPVTDARGSYDPNILQDLIDRELRGSPVYRIGQDYDEVFRDLDGLADSPVGKPISGKTLHYLKRAMDDLAFAKPSTEIGKEQANAIKDTRALFLRSLEGKIPKYGEARETYSMMSVPVNQMDVAGELRNKLVPAINDFGGLTRVRPQAYAQALREGDATTARVLGRSKASLGDVFNSGQLSTLEGVGKQLARRANADELGRAVGSNTGQNLVSQNILRQFLGPLGLPETSLQRAAESTLLQSLMRPAQWAGKLGEQRAMGLLAQAAMDPQTARSLLEAGVPPQTIGLLRYQGLLTPTALSGAYVARQ